MKLKNAALFFICAMLSVFSINAQQGKDSIATVTTTSIVNIYTPLTGSVAAGATSIAVASTAGLSAGDLIYIVQIQGATVNANTNYYGNPDYGLPDDTSFGKITAYNGAGNNEFAEITSISGNIITLDCALNNMYNDSLGGCPNTQVIRVPRYISLTLSGSGQITCPAWNGSTGGVVVIEVQGNTSLGSGTSINVAGMGFRGGAVLNASANFVYNTGANYGSAASNGGGRKGESIVGDTNFYKRQSMGADNWDLVTSYWLSNPLSACKGNVANGGGGGNGNNSGGGGGSNGGVINNWNGMGNPDNTTLNNTTAWGLESAVPVNGTFRPTSSSGGGRGGYAFSQSSSATADPTVTGPGSTVWGGNDRHNDGGWGGIPLDYSTGRIFLGGGGGAGDSNDKNGTSGGNGGGLVYLLSYGTVTGAGKIIADGAKALNTNGLASGQGDDGAGGGGGGGTVFINSTGNISLTNTLAISAQGGIGGDYFMHNGSITQNFGPGGGGGGGYVSTTNAVTGVNVNGGVNGIVAGAAQGSSNTTKIATKFPPNGATAGGAGSTTTFTTSNFYLTTTNYTTCASSSGSLSVTVNGNAPSGLSVNWYTVATGGTLVFTGNPYPLTTPSSVGTYTYYAGTCPGTSRIPVIVSVNPAGSPTLSIVATSSATCGGSNDTLTVSSSAGSSTSYTWSANTGSAITNSVIVTPTSGTTIYTVTGTSTGSCAGTGTASISITANTAPTITITPTNYTLCSGSIDTLNATGSASSYTWSANAGSATTASVSVSPTINATYTVTSVNGVCSSTQTIAINVTATPTVVVTPSNTATICNGSSATFTASGATTTYSWSTGATTNTVSVSPVSNTTYTVTGYNSSCASATQTISVTTDAGPIKADSVLNSASCALSNGDYVINSVTGGVSPYQINFNGAGFATVSSFPDTVKNLAGNTYSVTIKDGVGCTYTTTATIGNTSAISKIDSVIANANCVPANSGTITINSVTGGTSPYQASINGGAYSAITFPYSFNNLTAGTYTVKVIDNTNCPHISTIIVGTNGGITSASVTPKPDTCGKGVGTISVSNIVGGASPYNYSLNNGAYQTVSTFTALPGVSVDSIKIKDNSGCIYPTAVTVGSISGPTTASITAKPDTCSKGVGTITIVNVTGGTNPYMYELNSGVYQTANTFTALVANTDTLKIKDNSGCSYSVTTTVTNTNVVITPIITSLGATTVCEGSSVLLTLSNASSFSYTWNTGATAQTITVTTGSNTPYFVVATSTTGCTAASNTVGVTVIPTTTVIVSSNSGTLCAGGTATLIAVLTPTTAISVTYTLASATGLSPMGSNTVTVNPSASGIATYTVTGTVGGCPATQGIVSLSVTIPPILNVTSSSTTICPGNSATLTATGSATTYSWSTNAGGVNSSSVIVTPLVNTTYTVVGNPADCPSFKTSSVNVYTVSPLVINPSLATICNDSSVTLSTSGGLQVYNWLPTSSSTGSTNLVHPSATTIYSVSGQDAFGCNYNTATATVTVIVCTTYSITIPNVFSPNGDNINDNFEVKATGITSLNCDIYDRWGLKLYTFNGASGYWDGTAKGGKEVDGTYFYVILTTDIKGDNHKYNGFIQLIR